MRSSLPMFTLLILSHLIRPSLAFYWGSYPPCAQPQLDANAPAQCDTNNVAAVGCLCGDSVFLAATARDVWRYCGCDVLATTVVTANSQCAKFNVSIALNQRQMLAAANGGAIPCVNPNNTTASSTASSSSVSSTVSGPTSQPTSTSVPLITLQQGAGITIGVIFGVALLTTGVYFSWRCSRRNLDSKSQQDRIIKIEHDDSQHQHAWPVEVGNGNSRYFGTRSEFGGELDSRMVNARMHELDSERSDRFSELENNKPS